MRRRVTKKRPRNSNAVLKKLYPNMSSLFSTLSSLVVTAVAGGTLADVHCVLHFDSKTEVTRRLKLGDNFF